MPECNACGEPISEQDEFCPHCATDLSQFRTQVPSPTSVKSMPASNSPASSSPIESSTKPSSSGSSAHLTLKRSGVLTTEIFPILSDRVVVGRFDPDRGPVDVDLGSLPEAELEHISRHHIQIYRNPSGQWLVKDLEAKNGSFYRAMQQSKWERIMDEQIIQDGDEIALGNVQFEFRVG